MPYTPSPAAAWGLLLLASVFEIAWALGLKVSGGWARGGPATIVLALALLGMWLLGLATRALPISSAYAVWTGIGAAGTAALGVLLFDEPLGPGRALSIALIVAGVVGLKLLGSD